MRKAAFWIGIAILIFVVGFPCPIQKMFGSPCPGCNMTTALYYLLHGNLQWSLWYHAMLIPTILAAGLVLWFKDNPTVVKRIVWIWAIAMLLYYGYRMFTIYPEAPMIYDSKNFLKILSERLDFQNIRSIIQSNK